MKADLIIDPDADTADEIMELARVSGADEVYPMSGGDLIVLGAVIADMLARLENLHAWVKVGDDWSR